MIKDIIIHNTGTGGGAIGAEAVLGRGSIPACAGGLLAYQWFDPGRTVYPRVCGRARRR